MKKCSNLGTKIYRCSNVGTPGKVWESLVNIKISYLRPVSNEKPAVITVDIFAMHTLSFYYYML